MLIRRGIQAVLVAVLALGTLVFSPPATEAAERVVPAAEDFVRIQYLDFLARQPDAPGLEFWARRIDGGQDPASLIDSMVSAPEFAETVAPLARLYQAYFLRTPDFEGLTFWVGRLRSGTSLSQVSSTFAASAEFVARYGTLSDRDFVDLIYQNVLGRAADRGGLEHWTGRLEAGASRGSVMLGFSESPEYVRTTFGKVRATMLYLGMLRRAPDGAGLAYWSGVIDTGTAYGNVVRGFLNSPEYQARLAQLLPARFPLTGEATTSTQARPALALKIDNTPSARPQIGVEQADVIYEEMVEGNLSRLIAVFHSRSPVTAGPVRSVRTSDFDILSALNYPLLGASGANSAVLSQLAEHPIVNVNALVAGNAYRRESGRNAPHNLFANPSSLWSRAAPPAGTPPFLFRYVARGQALVPSATPAAGFDIDFGRTTAGFRWSAARGGYLRTQDGSPQLDGLGRQFAPDNVIVMTTNYITSSADAASPEAVTLGVGRASIFTRGQRLECFWSRSNPTAQISYTDRDGRRCAISPGSTWVELAPPGSVTLR